jgi:hypothetical protein
MTDLEQQAHAHAARMRKAFVAKFTRPVRSSAAEAVYVHEYGMYLRRHASEPRASRQLTS